MKKRPALPPVARITAEDHTATLRAASLDRAALSALERQSYQTMKRAMEDSPQVDTFACVACGKHRFPDPGTVCFWCRGDGIT